ncbi:polyprenyl synthetase family protein [Candidatus Daviesbacteria bacterium]|nr:polyprenyl synthetase family protein [Candidatus Daviesbacteria bacterium]
MQQVAFDSKLSYTPKTYPMNQFLSYLKETAPQIDHQIDLFLTQSLQEIEKISPNLGEFIQIFKEASEGGKRLRGSLVKLGYELFGGDNKAEILKVSVATEIFQTAILAHDDIIDQSLTRRGKPTIYKRLGGDHYGISQTIALADAAFFLANKLIAESEFDEGKKNSALKVFNSMMLKTCLGEILDVEIPHKKKVIKIDDVMIISQFKTAWYTIIGPLSMGAILAGIDEDKLAAIEEFGKNLGTAFQIQDDILGVFGDEEKIGKSASSDIEEGKATLLIYYALNFANKEQKRYLDKFYGKKGLTDKQIQEIRQIFINTGSLDFSTKKCIKYCGVAKKIIPEIINEKDKMGFLIDMSQFLIERKN